MNDEALLKRIERLELHVDLLRQIAVNPEEYVLLDWVISKDLTRDQYEKMMSVLKEYTRSTFHNKHTDVMEDVPSLQSLSKDLISAIDYNDDELGKRAVAQILRNAVRMPAFSMLTSYVQLLEK